MILNRMPTITYAHATNSLQVYPKRSCQTPAMLLCVYLRVCKKIYELIWYIYVQHTCVCLLQNCKLHQKTSTNFGSMLVKGSSTPQGSYWDGMIGHESLDFYPIKGPTVKFIICVPSWQMGVLYPTGSMYGIFTYIYHKNQPNVGVYTIHGSYGYESLPNKPKKH